MSKQIQEAYIVAATRLPVGKRNGMFRNARPDDMLAHAIRAVVAQAPGVDPTRIGDVIVGCAIPEAEQGMNVARIGALLAGLPNTVPGITINRFCSSGQQGADAGDVHALLGFRHGAADNHVADARRVDARHLGDDRLDGVGQHVVRANVAEHPALLGHRQTGGGDDVGFLNLFAHLVCLLDPINCATACRFPACA